jgi:hypothetical protein
MTSSPEWILMPRDAFLLVFSFLGTTRDLGACAMVCSVVRNMIESAPELWQQIAVDKYGPDCAIYGFEHMYARNWRVLLQNDNKHAALPTINFNKPCYWKYNIDLCFYCCFITQIKWNRATDQVLIYIDVRGEFDLRDPSSSTVYIGMPGTDIQDMAFGFFGQWFPEVSVRGHFKGYIMYPKEHYKIRFTKSNDRQHVTFCYSNHNHMTCDYAAIEFPSWEQISRTRHFTIGQSPFAADTEESERARWRPLIPEAVLERHPEGILPLRRHGLTATWWV